MRRLPIVLLLVVAVGGGAWFLIPGDQPLSPERTLSPSERASTVEPAASASSHPALISAVAPEGAREAVPIEQAEPAAEDPCASVRAELEEVIVTCNEHEKTIAQLNKKLAAALRELGRLKYDETTPYGAFLSSYEADEIDDPDILAQIEDWLRQFPVILRPGEATWIAERRRLRDWQEWGGRNFEHALILFLGPDRLAAELPETRMAELRAYYADESLFD